MGKPCPTVSHVTRASARLEMSTPSPPSRRRDAREAGPSANQTNARVSLCAICFLLLVSSIYIVFHTHVLLDNAPVESGARGNKFVTNNHIRNLELVIDIPIPNWLDSRYKMKDPPAPLTSVIKQDIVDTSLQHMVAVAEATNAATLAVPISPLKPPPASVQAGPVIPVHPISPRGRPGGAGAGSDTTWIQAMSPPKSVAAAAPPAGSHGKAAAPLDENCPHIDKIKFWKHPTEQDLKWHNPYVSKGVTKYVTFEPDVGGWNNIRMQMEIVMVFAYATGRTLVLPPDQPMYLLNKGKGHEKAHNFRDFFPFDRISTRLPTISMREYLTREGVTGHLRRHNDTEVELPPGNRTKFDGTVRDDRLLMWEYLRNVSSCPTWKSMAEYVVIPPFPGFNSTLSLYAQQYKKRSLVFAGDPKYGATRRPVFYDLYWHQQRSVHFISKPALGLRLLEHFYTFLHFEDPFMDRFYKRFVRDYVHYLPTIFCKAAVIVAHLRQEGGGQYSSFHVRRGELQYKEVKVNGSVLIDTVQDVLPKGALLFIATDESNRTFFDPFKARGWSRIRHLGDYLDIADLRGLNPNYLGMLDQVVCSGGEIFVGTWFSTFTAYITRMRGYLGHADNSTWYGDKVHKERFQKYELPRFPFYVREYPIAWHNIEEKAKTP